MCLCCISHCKNPKCLFSDFVRMDICLITQLRSLFQSFFFSIIQFFRVFSLFVILASILSRIFFFHIATSDRNLVLTAMAEWELVTCVRFRPATAEDIDLVIFRDGSRSEFCSTCHVCLLVLCQNPKCFLLIYLYTRLIGSVNRGK